MPPEAVAMIEKGPAKRGAFLSRFQRSTRCAVLHSAGLRRITSGINRRAGRRALLAGTGSGPHGATRSDAHIVVLNDNSTRGTSVHGTGGGVTRPRYCIGGTGSHIAELDAPGAGWVCV